MPKRREKKIPDEDERELSLERLRTSLIGPAGAQREGWKVSPSSAAKEYRCPYCNGMIPPNTPHLVAYPHDRLSDRRHYHTACWTKQAKAPRA